jgi:hypothetical protein
MAAAASNGNGQAISGLSHRTVFGLAQSVKGTAWWLDEGTLIYAAGACVVAYAVDARTQRFLHTSTGVLSCLALSPNRRCV